jgi:hypothetical protein
MSLPDSLSSNTLSSSTPSSCLAVVWLIETELVTDRVIEKGVHHVAYLRLRRKIVIETANVEIDEMYVQQHPSTKSGRYLMLTVSDTGSGMDMATQSHIFDLTPPLNLSEFLNSSGQLPPHNF